MFTVKDYREALEEGYLLASKCERCGAIHLPPRPVCPKCCSRKLERFRASKRGRVAAYAVIHIPPSRMRGEEPYAVAIVELMEGMKLSGRLLGISTCEEIDTGIEVKVDFIKVGDKTLPCFRPLRVTHP